MEILKAMERVRHSKNNTKRWWPKNDSNNYYSKQCLHVSRMKNRALSLSFHGLTNLGFILFLRELRGCREIKRHLLTKEQRVKDMMAINVMSLFAPDPGVSSSSLPLFSTYPCRAFSVFTPPHGLPRGWLAENTSDSTAQTGPEANGTHINKHTRAAAGQSYLVGDEDKRWTWGWILKKTSSLPAFIGEFLPTKYNFYYYFSKKSQSDTEILVQPLFCSFLVLWALPLKLE